MQATFTTYVRDGRTWVPRYTENNEQAAYAAYADDLTHKYIFKSRGISSIHRIKTYDGYLRVRVYYSHGVMREYELKF